MKVGLLGYPLKKTLSPDIFDFLCSKTGLSGEYFLFKRNPLEFKIKGLSEIRDLTGFNVTAPFKEIFAKACLLKGEAKKIKTVNVVKIVGNKFIGRDTDIFGFEESLKENKIAVKNKTVCVWGTGGGAKAVVFALGRLEAKKVFVFSRKKERALKFAGFFRKIFKKADIEGLENSYLSPDSTGIFISAVSFVYKKPRKIFNFGGIDKKAIFMDLAYSASLEKTRFLKLALSRGAEKMIDGKGMLFYQAVGSFEFWTGRRINNPLKLKKEFFKKRRLSC